MPVNPFFASFTNSAPNQALIDALTVQAVQVNGINVYYIPRTIDQVDQVYNEDDSSRYESNYLIEMYLKDYGGYMGDGELLQKFGIEFRQQLTVQVAITTFKNLVGDLTARTRPLEGDLIYFPMDHKLFFIKKVNKYSDFYQLGSLQTYDLICEVFEYSGETFNTGIAFLDNMAKDMSNSTEQEGTIDANGQPAFSNGFTWNANSVSQPQNQVFGDYANSLIDFSQDNPYSESF